MTVDGKACAGGVTGANGAPDADGIAGAVWRAGGAGSVACAGDAADAGAAPRAGGAGSVEPAADVRLTPRLRGGGEALGERPVTLSLAVAYKGAAFCGFARQPGQLTVQGELESALRTLFRRDVETTCAGRTDAGVHARGQVVSFDLLAGELRDRTRESLRRSLNALVHDDVTVRDVALREPGFSARFDAVCREYRYFICLDETKPLFMRDFSWHQPKGLDVRAMERASRCLIGEHDFKSFCLAASAVGKPTCRNVSEISFSEELIMGERCLCITVVGNAFLHSMVRTIVGTLVAVGRGQREPEWVERVLAARNRSVAGENAPAQGLVFWHVAYE